MKLVKGLIMAAMMVFAQYQTGEIVWAASLITAVTFFIGYAVKNAWLPSISEDGVFDWRDMLSAVVLAVVVAVGDAVGDLVINGVIAWGDLAQMIISVVVTYFTGTFFGNAKK